MGGQDIKGILTLSLLPSRLLLRLLGGLTEHMLAPQHLIIFFLRAFCFFTITTVGAFLTAKLIPLHAPQKIINKQ